MQLESESARPHGRQIFTGFVMELFRSYWQISTLRLPSQTGTKCYGVAHRSAPKVRSFKFTTKSCAHLVHEILFGISPVVPEALWFSLMKITTSCEGFQRAVNLPVLTPVCYHQNLMLQVSWDRDRRILIIIMGIL